ncbi:MAG: M48 family metallopeptidase, partial [Cyanobacteria bacterium J06623_1]
LLFILLWIPQFFVRVKRPTGISLKREQAPELFAILDHIAATLQAPKLTTVILNDEMNAAILQRPRFGFIGWQTSYLIIGLPLMQAISPQQCQAVLAHEFAHLCGDDSRNMTWIYRIRRVWYELAERYENDSRQGNILFKRFFKWYGPYFKAYSFIHARAQEYEADRRAADIIGAQHKAEALISLHVNDVMLDRKFWPEFERRSRNLQEPPDNFITQMLDALQTKVKPNQYQKWLAICLAYQTDNSSTHPCLTDRLEALDYQISESLASPKERAITLLGEQLENLIEQLNQLWKKENADTWKDNYELRQNQLMRLGNLNTKPQPQLTIEERIKQASIVWSLQEKQMALPMFQSVVADAPDHTVARYWLGLLLLEQQNNDDGISHLQYALEHDPSLLISACRRLYSFYLEQNQPALAETYKQRWQDHRKAWMIAQKERINFDHTAQFAPHKLAALEIEQLVEHLSKHPEVKAVYLARKIVERFPEHPYYIMLITRRYIPGMGADYKPDSRLEALLRSEIAFSRDYSLQIEAGSTHWQRLKQLKGTLLFHD